MSSEVFASGLARRHLRFGWWSLFVFATVGLVLESLHGFKAGAYLNVGNETRRLMWTLGHAHGSMLALVHVAWAFTLRALPDVHLSNASLASRALMASSVLLPGGFFLGGAVFYGGDPGLGILLVPVGAVCLLYAVASTARAAAGAGAGEEAVRPPKTKTK